MLLLISYFPGLEEREREKEKSLLALASKIYLVLRLIEIYYIFDKIVDCTEVFFCAMFNELFFPNGAV